MTFHRKPWTAGWAANFYRPASSVEGVAFLWVSRLGGSESITISRTPLCWVFWLLVWVLFSSLPYIIHKAERLVRGCIFITVMNLENVEPCFNDSGFLNRKINRNKTTSFSVQWWRNELSLLGLHKK